MYLDVPVEPVLLQYHLKRGEIGFILLLGDCNPASAPSRSISCNLFFLRLIKPQVVNTGWCYGPTNVLVGLYNTAAVLQSFYSPPCKSDLYLSASTVSWQPSEKVSFSRLCHPVGLRYNSDGHNSLMLKSFICFHCFWILWRLRLRIVQLQPIVRKLFKRIKS